MAGKSSDSSENSTSRVFSELLSFISCAFKPFLRLALRSLALPKISASVAHAAHRCSKFGGTMWTRTEEHTSEIQSLIGISYAVLLLKKKKQFISNSRD